MPHTPDITRWLPAVYWAGQPFRDCLFSNQWSPDYNQLHPFRNARDYQFAQLSTLRNVPKSRIHDFFRNYILPLYQDEQPTTDVSFKSGYTFYKQRDKMIKNSQWHTGEVQYVLRPQLEFKYRNLLECIQYLLRHWAFVCRMLWELMKIFDNKNKRIYAKINIETWWWN